MRLGLWIATGRPFRELLDLALEAEQLGYDSIYLADHFMSRTAPPLEPRLEAWTTLGALAACTTRARLGVLVTGNTYRHPAVVAKMAATTDRISGGRVTLGIGAGWQRNEHEAYGIDLPEPVELLGRLDEACQVVRLLFDNPLSDFDGRWYHLEQAPCEPKPVQEHLPLLVGVAGEKVAMAIAARHADIWNYWGTPESIEHKLAVLDEHCERAGRDPATLARSTQALVRMSEDDAEVQRFRQEPAAQPTISGSPAEISDAFGRYAELGVSEFIVSDRTLGSSPSERTETMTRLIEDVAAPFRG